MDDFRIRNVRFMGGEGNEGFTVDPELTSGWDDGTDTRLTQVEMPQAHGSFDLPTFQSDRVISIGGLCLAPTAEKLAWFRSQLTGLLADGGTDKLVGQFAGVSAFANVRQGAKPQFAVQVWGSIAKYQAQFWAPDPRKYGEGRLFPAATTVTAFHYGNFPAIPVLTVTGTATGYTIAGPSGKLFTVTHAVASGHPHSIDMATGLLSIDGAVVVGAVSQGDTWAIPAGTQVPMTITPLSGSLTLAAAVSDTYI